MLYSTFGSCYSFVKYTDESHFKPIKYEFIPNLKVKKISYFFIHFVKIKKPEQWQLSRLRVNES